MRRSGLVALLAVACSARAPVVAERAPARRADFDAAPFVGPARYLVAQTDAPIERAAGGAERAVVGGARVEIIGHVPSQVAVEPLVDGGFAIPAWAALRDGPRYAFWKGRSVFVASTFTGPLTKIGDTPSDVVRAFPWVDGVGVVTNVGPSLVRPRGPQLVAFGVPGALAAAAADARRGVVLTAFGHALVTLDGGASYRDRTAELPAPHRVEVRGDAIAVAAHDGRERFIGPSGAVADTLGGAARAGARHDADPWLLATDTSALETAARAGVAIDRDTALIVGDGRVGRIDLRSGRGTVIGELPDATLDCAPIRLGRAVLLACASEHRAMVIDAASLRVERTFDDLGALDRFVGDDDAGLGFVGPCVGAPRAAPDVDAVTSASFANNSNQRSAVFCARASAERWVEHRLDAADSGDVVAWVPRSDGGAVALVLRPGALPYREPPVSTRGSLRIVRLARNEPPLAVSAYASGAPRTLVRDLVARADGSIEGWIAGGTQGYGTSIAIDADGHARQRSLPMRTSAFASAGRFALAQTQDGRFVETTDRGASWHDVDPPPGGAAAPTACSSVACALGAFVRVGWTSATAPPSPPDARTNAPATGAKVGAPAQSPPRPAVAHLVCRATAAAESARIPDSYGFGVTPTPVPRPVSPARIGTVGALAMPWNGATAPSGDADVAHVPLFDLAAPIRRMTIPSAQAGALTPKRRMRDLRLGYVLAPRGRVDLIALGTDEACGARLLNAAGIVRPMNGCMPDPTVGVEIGSALTLLTTKQEQLVVTELDDAAAPRARAAKDAPERAAPPVVKERRTIPTPWGARNVSFGVGVRAGAPIAIAVEGSGGAVLAPIDLDHGGIGAEEPLAPLGELAAAADARCRGDARDEARVVLPLDGSIGLGERSLPGVLLAGAGGVAVLRWSKARVCVEAIELPVRDERYELDPGLYDAPGTLRKIVARLDRVGGPATLLVIGPGFELRQKLACEVTPR